MIGLDTNVLVRYLTQDEPDQAFLASQFVEGLDESEPGFVSLVALVELHWVLRRAYKVSRDDAAAVVRRLLDAREVAVQQSDAVRRSLTRISTTVDFADALIAELGTAAGCHYTATLDRGAARIPGMRLLPRP